MSDEADRAQQREEADRESALRAALNRADVTPLVINGAISCLDCGEGISSARLAAQPNAGRCFDCQCLYEEKMRRGL